MRQKTERHQDAAERTIKDIRRPWESIRRTAGLDDVHFHDLRHSYASLLVNDGASLPIIGRLLGHTQAQTTMRYAHLADDPLSDQPHLIGPV
jgi:integrase